MTGQAFVTALYWASCAWAGYAGDQSLGRKLLTRWLPLTVAYIVATSIMASAAYIPPAKYDAVIMPYKGQAKGNVRTSPKTHKKAS